MYYVYYGGHIWLPTDLTGILFLVYLIFLFPFSLVSITLHVMFRQIILLSPRILAKESDFQLKIRLNSEVFFVFFS